ncbi:MAG TPA: hypothetical protein DCZ87_06640 [Chitinophagaceae bacterium]|nr:hypothetical protein [Chitinophagaceae bacterium]
MMLHNHRFVHFLRPTSRMEKKLLFTSEELLLDERFLSWVEGVGKDTDNQWVKTLIAFSPEQEDEVADAVSLYRALHLQIASSSEVSVQKQRLFDRLDRLQGHGKQRTFINSQMAASLFFLVVIFLALWNNATTDQSAINTMTASANSRRLSDGTLVTLASNSTITLSPEFEKAPLREVWVKGEVEFAVQKKKDKKPFVVHMDPFDVEVTGTVFQAINRPERASVLLREGSVQLIFKDGQRLRMSPGDFYAYNRPALAPSEQPGLLREGAALERKIVFEDLTIAEVATQIEKRYPVKIIIASSELAGRRLTGILPNDNLEVLINALQIATESISKQQGATIVFTPQ